MPALGIHPTSSPNTPPSPIHLSHATADQQSISNKQHDQHHQSGLPLSVGTDLDIPNFNDTSNGNIKYAYDVIYSDNNQVNGNNNNNGCINDTVTNNSQQRQHGNKSSVNNNGTVNSVASSNGKAVCNGVLDSAPLRLAPHTPYVRSQFASNSKPISSVKDNTKHCANNPQRITNFTELPNTRYRHNNFSDIASTSILSTFNGKPSNANSASSIDTNTPVHPSPTTKGDHRPLSSPALSTMEVSAATLEVSAATLDGNNITNLNTTRDSYTYSANAESSSPCLDTITSIGMIARTYEEHPQSSAKTSPSLQSSSSLKTLPLFEDEAHSLCTATSYSGVSESAGAWGEQGHYNILHVTTRDPGQHWFTRYCCYLSHCYRLRVNFPYPTIHNKMILSDERIQTALDQVVSEGLSEGSSGTYRLLMEEQVKRAQQLLNNMKSAICTTLIRLTGYVLFKVFSRLLKSVVVHKGQLESIQRASKRGTPLIFVPLHRSHVDYLFVTWVLFNCQIPAPIVAAGDNLNMPVFGALLRGTGGFFIKRRLESNKTRRDVLYRALLQCYMSQSLHAGYNLEFFIEGGRTRTGKPAMPKGGLLSVIVDAYLSGMLNDALIVPVAINYDKLVDGDFITEQLGQSKVQESFWGAVCAIFKVLSTNYGQSRIDFGAPFSLQEFVQRSHIPLRQLMAPPAAVNGQQAKGHHRSLSTPVSESSPHLTVKRVPSGDAEEVVNRIHPAMSNSSLFGSELTDEFRELVKKLGQHIVFDAERCQALMSSNLLSWLLSFVHRDGATLATLSSDVAELRDVLHRRGRDVGFTGDAAHVVMHAVHLLGPGLIKSELGSEGQEVFYKPVTLLPNVIELNYYANALLPVFALDAIIAISVLSVLECNLSSYVDCDTSITLELDKVMRSSERLCELLAHEFVLVAPCGKLSSKLLDVIDNLQISGLLNENKSLSKGLRRHNNHDDDATSWLYHDGGAAVAESDDSTDAPLYTVIYNVNPTSHSLKYLSAFSAMLCPLLDAYCTTIECLQQLVGKQMPEKEFVIKTQDIVRQKLESGALIYGESIAADPIKNCLKMLEGDRILESCQVDGSKHVSLTRAYDAAEAISPVLDNINALRV